MFAGFPVLMYFIMFVLVLNYLVSTPTHFQIPVFYKQESNYLFSYTCYLNESHFTEYFNGCFADCRILVF